MRRFAPLGLVLAVSCGGRDAPAPPAATTAATPAATTAPPPAPIDADGIRPVRELVDFLLNGRSAQPA